MTLAQRLAARTGLSQHRVSTLLRRGETERTILDGSYKRARGRRRGQLGRCLHCHLEGHYQRGCHLAAEGRHEPDDADRLACELLVGLPRRSPGTSIRSMLAHRLRLRLATGEIVLREVQRA